MALINRFEIINYLDKTDEAGKWQPNFRLLHFNMQGLSSLVRMDNGQGKTSMASTLYLLLTRNLSLASEVKEKMSPTGLSSWSHIRVEVIVNDDSQPLFVGTGAAVTGETWVFGVCGHREDGLKFYFYHGCLEDLPAAHRSGDRTVFLTNKEFVENQKLLDRVRWEPSMEDYKDHLNSIFPPRAFDLGLDLHIRGGAENDDIFPVQGKHPESELFYNHIAPHLLASDLQPDETTEDGEYFFEDTIIKSATLYGQASVQTEAKRKEVERFEKTVRLATRLREAAVDAKEKETRAKDARRGVDVGLVILDRIVQEQVIPGIPNEVRPDGVLGDLVAGLVWHADEKQLCLQDFTLATIVGSPLNHLNRDAGRYSISAFNKEKRRMVLSRSAALKLEKQERGKVYPVESIYKFLDRTGVGFPEKLTLLEMKDLVRDATEWWRKNVDTNPSRPLVHHTQFTIGTITDKIRELESDIESLGSQENEINRKIQDLNEVKSAWDNLAGSSLFSEEELRTPKTLGEQVKKDFNEANSALLNHRNKTLELTSLEPAYVRYIQQFPGISPNKAMDEQERKRTLLTEAEKTARDNASRANKELRSLQEIETKARKSVEALERKQDSFTRLAPGVRLYADIFNEESCVGLTKKVKEALGQAEQKITSLGTEKSLHVKDVTLVHEFEKQHPRGECATLHQQIKEEVGVFQKKIDQLDQQKSECETRLEDLRKHKITPSPIARKALDILDSPKIVHEVVSGLELPPARLATVLYSLSSVLFSPVFTSPPSVEKAVITLEEHRIPVPVFLEKSLVDYARNHEIRQEEGLHYALLAGLETLTAATIIDPEKIHNLIEEAARELNIIDHALFELCEEKKSFDDRLEYLTKVKRVIDAGFVERDNKIALELKTLYEDLPQLEKRGSDDALHAIRDRQEYDNLGGASVANSLSTEMAQCNVQLSMATDNLALAKDHDSACDLARESAMAALTNFQSNWGQLKADIQDAIKYLKENGPTFLPTAEYVEKELEKGLNRSKNRLPYDFEKAQKFLESGEKNREWSEALTKIREHLTNKAEEKASLDKEKESKEKQYKKEWRRMARVDEGIAEILALWKDFYDAIKEFTGGSTIRSLKELRVLVAEKTSSSQTSPLQMLFTAVDRITKSTREGGDAEHIKQAFDSISDTLNAFGEKIESIRTKQRSAKKAKEGFTEECTRYLETAEGLAPNEREIIAAEDVDYDEVLELFRKFDAICRNERARLDELTRGIEAITSKAHERLATLLEFARDNRRLLKSVASRSAEGTIIIEDTMIEDDALKDLIRNLLQAVESELKARQERKKNQFGAEGSRVEAEWNKTLRKQIAEWFYRGVFPTARVKVQHPSVRGGRPITFRKKGVSSGERLAIALVIIGKLQEFIQEREERHQIKSSARRKKRGKTQGILLLDGIFSKLSQKEMIQVAMDAYRGLKGRFQLIGLNHYPIENDEEVFPNFFEVRKVTTTTGGFLVLDKDYKPVDPKTRGMETGELIAARATITQPHPQETNQVET